MVKISDLISLGAEKLKFVAENPRNEARILLAHAFSISVSEVILNMDMPADNSKQALFENCIAMRAEHKPIAYITGEKEFYGMPFYVNEHTLIPRPETEMVVEEILASEKTHLLDLCTGSGCIPIAACKNSSVTGLGIDISAGAVEMAVKNAKRHNLENKLSFEVCDIFEKNHFGTFDILTSNPPYITDEDMLSLAPDVANFEPYTALSGGIDGLDFYRRIVEIAPENLSNDGMLIFEIGIGEGDAVASLMENNFTNIKIKKDLAGIDRVVTGRIRRI